MGTHQELTTAQVEVLILINDICDFITDNNLEDEFETNMNETVCSIFCVEKDEDIDNSKQSYYNSICDILHYYGYVDEDYFITTDGKQYLYLFKEYLDAKSSNINITHKSYSLINIGELELSVEACLGKISIGENIGKISEFGSDLIDSFKKVKKAYLKYKKKNK